MDVRFFQLVALHWLWVAGLIAAVAAWSLASRRRRLRRLAEEALVKRLVPRFSTARPAARAALAVLALVALVAAMIDPRWGVEYQDVHHRGIDVVFALDTSRSMLAEDARPSRLQRASQYIGDLLGALGGDRVGLVTFAGVAAVRTPLTVDYGALRLALEDVTPDTAARGGSNIGDAVRRAAESFTDEVRDHKAIIVLTDGEDHGSYPVEAAQQAFTERGIRVYTVGLGDAGTGARIPVVEGGRRLYLVHEGQEVWSKMNASVLRDMAVVGGGAFIPAGTAAVDMARVYQEKVAPAVAGREIESRRVRRYNARYQWFAGLALILLLAESLISDRRTTNRTEIPE
jgi:Ca-activated chloride channel family protein